MKKYIVSLLNLNPIPIGVFSTFADARFEYAHEYRPGRTEYEWRF